MPWILLLLISLFSTPSLAVAIPGVTTGATATSKIRRLRSRMQNKKRPIAHLPTSRMTPPAGADRSVEEGGRHAASGSGSDHYATADRRGKDGTGKRHRHQPPLREALSSRFAQLYRNLVGTSHKPFNPHLHRSRHAVCDSGGCRVHFYWLLRLCAAALPEDGPLGTEKISIKAAGCTSRP